MADPMTQLRGYLLQAAMDPNRETRMQAQLFLDSVESQPGFPILLLELVAHSTRAGAPPEDLAIQQAASVFFKNIVKRCWSPEEEGKPP